MPFVRLIELDRCRADRGTFVNHGELELAVFRLESAPHVAVIDNTCPHAGSNLSGGEVEGRVVACPLHHWQFDLDTGRCVDAPNARVTSYRVEIRDGIVYVDLPAA